MWRILVKLMSNKPKSKLVELMFCWKFLLMFQEIICKVETFIRKNRVGWRQGWKLKWWTWWQNNQLIAGEERIAIKTKATIFSISSHYLFFWWWITEVLSTFSRWKQVFMINYLSKLPVREAVNLTKVRKMKYSQFVLSFWTFKIEVWKMFILSAFFPFSIVLWLNLYNLSITFIY